MRGIYFGGIHTNITEILDMTKSQGSSRVDRTKSLNLKDEKCEKTNKLELLEIEMFIL